MIYRSSRVIPKCSVRRTTPCAAFGAATTSSFLIQQRCLGPSFPGHLRLFSSTCLRKAIVPFKLHDIGEGITEVEMLKWVVVEGQTVDHFDDLCEVQSDKSTAELTSPVPGIVHSIKVREGDTVKVGQTLCEIKTDEPEEEELPRHGEVAGPTEVPAFAAEVAESTEGQQTNENENEKNEMSEPPEKQTKPTSPSRSETTSGRRHHHHYEEDELPISTGVEFSGEAAVLPAAPPPTAVNHDQPVPTRRAREEEGTKRIIMTSPAVRSLAGKLGLDLADITGTGDRGRITRQDVDSYVATSSSAASTGLAKSPHYGLRGEQIGSGLSRGNRAKWDEVTRVPFGRTRKVMYRALAAQAQVPHFGYSHTLDLTPLAPYLKALNPPQQSSNGPSYLAADIPSHLVGSAVDSTRQKTTLLSLLVKSMLLAMEEHPVMRSKVVEQDSEKLLEIRKDGIIGIAVSDPKYGLVTPSLPAIHPSTSLSGITSAITSLRQNPTKMGLSANVVISSVGGLGEAANAMPVIPPGGPIAICAVGQAKWEVEWNLRDGGMKMDRDEIERGGMKAVLRCTVGWSGDHRVLEGAELIAFTESWKKYIEEPSRWLTVD